jgi:hypothetical protein
MKTLILILFIISLSNAGNFLEVPEDLNQQMGKSCVPNPVFNVTYFDVSPWPTENNSSMAVNMTGIFSSTVFVQFLSIGTNYNRLEWHYTQTNLSTTYYRGQQNSFLTHTFSGDQNGQYIKEYVLSNQDINGNLIVLSCWQYYYSF